MNPKHFFFDLDNTVTESRSPITNKMRDKLNGLDEDVIIISGAEKERMDKQLDGVKCFKMAQSGAYCEYWIDRLSDNQFNEIKDYCQLIQDRFPSHKFFFQDRGCQVTLGFIDPEADLEVKKNFDKSKQIRQSILDIIPFISLNNMEVKIAGSTSLDFIKKTSTKGRNIEKLIEYNGWDKKDCVYYGDALEENGNDYSVVGVIDTIPVLNPDDLCQKL